MTISLRLLNLLVVHQPKILVVAATAHRRTVATLPLELVWDPLVEQLEAPACPECGRPTYEFSERRGQLVCPSCAAAPTAVPPGRPQTHGRISKPK